MAATTVLDVESVLAPISADSPTGVDPRSDANRNGDFRTIKDAREEARQIERQADLDGQEPTQSLPHWRKVRDLGRTFLAAQAKDLEVVSCMVEALARTDGFAGLEQGFRLARGVVETFWDDLYPRPDEDGVETTIRPLGRLDSLLPAPIARIPITEGRAAGPYACWHHRQADELSRASEREREQRLSRGAVSLEKFTQAVAETETPFLRQMAEDIAGCQREYAALCDALDQRCGQDSNGHSLAPPSSAIRESLESCLNTLRYVAGDRLPTPAENGAADGADAALGGAAKPGVEAPAAGGALRTRDDAFRALGLVAEFFEAHDPHSLLAARVREVVRLGRLSREEYYSEVLADRDQFMKLHGLKGPG